MNSPENRPETPPDGAWKRFSAVQVPTGWLVLDNTREGTISDATITNSVTGRKMLPTNRTYAEKLAALLNERYSKQEGK